MTSFVVEADGGSRGNPGPAATAPWSRTPRTARCWWRSLRRSAPRPTTSPNTEG
ncbi:hypothetical protein ACFQX6_60955 [Streptosporangium lutulentum]